MFTWSSNFDQVPTIQFLKSDSPIYEQEIGRHKAVYFHRRSKYIKWHLSHLFEVSEIAEVGSLYFMHDLFNTESYQIPFKEQFDFSVPNSIFPSLVLYSCFCPCRSNVSLTIRCDSLFPSLRQSHVLVYPELDVKWDSHSGHLTKWLISCSRLTKEPPISLKVTWSLHTSTNAVICYSQGALPSTHRGFLVLKSFCYCSFKHDTVIPQYPMCQDCLSFSQWLKHVPILILTFNTWQSK